MFQFEVSIFRIDKMSRAAGRTAVEEVALGYRNGERYEELRATRNTPANIYRVQISADGCTRVGVGFSREEAKEAAAEAFLDYISGLKTPLSRETKDLIKQNALLEKRLLELAITTRELGVDTIDKLLDQILGNEEIIGDFDASKIEEEIIELLEKLGAKLTITKHYGSAEHAIVLIIASDKEETITVVEFGKEATFIMLLAMSRALVPLKFRLQAEISKMMTELAESKKAKIEQRKKIKKSRKTRKVFGSRRR